VKPKTISINSVIVAWARSKDKVAAERAEVILNRMQELYESGNIDAKPNTVIFNSIIGAWTKSHYPIAPQRRAKAILYRLEESYTAAIKAWSNSGHANNDREIAALQK
jgi:hypothetical protein